MEAGLQNLGEDEGELEGLVAVGVRRIIMFERTADDFADGLTVLGVDTAAMQVYNCHGSDRKLGFPGPASEFAARDLT